jgi:protein O-GlcNAcase/histone acetyltransferase
MAPVDLEKWGSLAAAQAGVVNDLYRWAREQFPETSFSFCPTPYCGRMASRHLGGEGCLEVIGRELDPGIDVFWTGPEIISREITVEHAREVASVLRRKPLIWDNLHANDYDGRRFFCGPYAGRPPDLKGEVRGLLVNPNNEFWLNYVPLRTLGAFVNAGGPWNEREAYLDAMRAWLETLTAPGFEIAFEDWVRLGDCFYLPYEEGPGAKALLERARRLLGSDPKGWGKDADAFLRESARLRELCGRLANLRQRPVFHAMSRRLWDLREELDVVEKFIAFKRQLGNASRPFTSDYHLPGTFRGGFVAEWQRLLDLKPDGTFTPGLHES